MADVMQRFRPDVVFHAAAYKHVSLMEENPLEAVRNNAIGTRVTATAAAAAGDGEVRARLDRQGGRTPARAWARRRRWPSGSSRRSAAAIPARSSATVRFGNVLGSQRQRRARSSAARSRRAARSPSPTRRCTRYFMTIPEAVQLIIRAGRLASGGETFVLEMGEQVKIIDLARNMIRLSGHDPDEDTDRDRRPPARREAARGAVPRGGTGGPHRGRPYPEGRAAPPRS